MKQNVRDAGWAVNLFLTRICASVSHPLAHTLALGASSQPYLVPSHSASFLSVLPFTSAPYTSQQGHLQTGRSRRGCVHALGALLLLSQRTVTRMGEQTYSQLYALWFCVCLRVLFVVECACTIFRIVILLIKFKSFRFF